MSKTFLEVFPTLKVEDALIGLLEKAEVTKVSANHDNSHVRIYLRAERLIPKKYIWYLEKEIKKQLFPKKQIFIKIIESFALSEICLLTKAISIISTSPSPLTSPNFIITYRFIFPDSSLRSE